MSEALDTIASPRGLWLFYLYGPRGNGKTALLADLQKEAGKRKLGALKLVGTPSGWMRTVAPFSPRGSRGELSGTVEVPETVRLSGTYRPASVPDERRFSPHRLPEFASAPLLVTADEAHAVPPEEIGDLLRVARSLRADSVPVLLAMAGTPDLEFVLRGLDVLGEPERTIAGAKATFWDRGKRIRVGLLPDGVAAEILEETGAGLRFEPATLARLAAAASRYPYFVQLLGSAVWEAAGGAGTVDAACAERALAAFAVERDAYYGLRLRELEDSDLERVAYSVAVALEAGGGEIGEWELNRTLEAALGRERRVEAGNRLAGTGFVWETATRRWSGGIPSLVESVRHEYSPSPSSSEPGLSCHEPRTGSRSVREKRALSDSFRRSVAETLSSRHLTEPACNSPCDFRSRKDSFVSDRYNTHIPIDGTPRKDGFFC